MTTNDGWDASDLSPPGQLPTIPEVTLLRELARGGMGIVYRGRQDFLERDVAVKLLSPQMQDERFAARFRREAKLLAGIKHAHIVACYAAGVTPEGQHYLVMELVEGPTLERWIAQNGPPPLRSALRLCNQLAAALGHACELGVIHRDVKTANILLEAPTGTSLDPLFPFVPKLVDLGLARLVAGSTDLAQTAPGSVMGTPATMAPEQFDAPDAVDFRADIYGLGCVLYELLTGAPAFPSQRLTELVVQKRQPRGPNPCAHDAAIPPAVGELVAAMLAHDPAERPADYRALRTRLEELMAAPRATMVTKLSPPPRATSAPAAVAASGEAIPAANENLLRTAEFEFLAAGHDSTHGGAAAAAPASAFVSRVSPPPASAPAPAVPPSAAARPLRVVGARPVATLPAQRRRLGNAATFAGVALLAFAAVPWWWPRPPVHEPPPMSPPSGQDGDAPADAPTAETAGASVVGAAKAASTTGLDVDLLGLDGPLRRGDRLLMRSRVRGDADPTLRYAWSVEPANAVELATPDTATTTLRHELLPGDAFTLRLRVGRPGEGEPAARDFEQHVVVRYEPRNLFADFFRPDGDWQPNGRVHPTWQQRDEGGIVVAASEVLCVASRGLDGDVWRLAGTMVPERAEVAAGEPFAAGERAADGNPPVFRGGERRGQERNGQEPREFDEPGPEMFGPEPRGPEMRGPDGRGLPPRGQERRGPPPRPLARGQELRGQEPRGQEPRGPGLRGQEARAAERRSEPAPVDPGATRITTSVGFAQSVVGLRLSDDRHLAIVCTRSGANGERWSLSLQQLVEDGRAGFTLRPLPEAAGKAIEASDALGATYTVTRRQGELLVQFGFAGRPQRTEYRATLPRASTDVGLTLLARSGRVVFPELVLW